MKTINRKERIRRKQLPLYVEKDEDGFYVIECPLFTGCYTQGETLDEALKNIKEVIELVLEEKSNMDVYRSYNPREFSLHTISI
jgi:predicted RNase H-like HicB family nuclease